MQAKIVRIMESWPLQLVLETGSGIEHVALKQDARVVRGGTSVDPGVLQPGQTVVVLKRTSTGEIAELAIVG